MEQLNFPLSSESWPNLDNSSNVKVSSKQVERSKNIVTQDVKRPSLTLKLISGTFMKIWHFQ